jgi:hypothetical protein
VADFALSSSADSARCGWATKTLAISGTGSYGHHAAEPPASARAEECHGDAPLLSAERLEVDVARTAVFAHRDRRAELTQA